MKGDYFVEFMYYDPALKQQERYKFLIDKYKESTSLVKELKIEKILEIDKFLGILDALELEVKELKKSLPSSIEELNELPEEKEVVREVPKVTHVVHHAKHVVKKKHLVRKPIKPVGKSLDALRLGLEQIKDELSKM